MKTTWVLVADSSRARVFEATTSRGEMQEIDAFVHTESRLREQDLTADLPGRAFDSHGQGRHAMGAKRSPKQQEHFNFASQLDHYLDDARKQNRFDQLIIAAPPEFLGLLRSGLTNSTAKRVKAFIDKDLTRETPTHIRTYLPEYL